MMDEITMKALQEAHQAIPEDKDCIIAFQSDWLTGHIEATHKNHMGQPVQGRWDFENPTEALQILTALKEDA